MVAVFLKVQNLLNCTNVREDVSLRLRYVWLPLLWLLVSPVYPQSLPSDEFRLRFRVYPPDAQVYRVVGKEPSGTLNLELLGRADGLQLKKSYAQQPCRFILKRSGFHFGGPYGWDPSLPIRSATGDYFDYFPIDGAPPIVGEPNNWIVGWWVSLRLHPKLFWSLVLVLVGLGIWMLKTLRDRSVSRRGYQKRLAALTSAGQDDPMLGATLGRFLVVENLGRGNRSTLYKAVPKETLEPDESVTIKWFSGERNDSEADRRFRQELQIQSELQHPYIVRVDNWGHHEGRPYTVLEYISGETLDKKIPNQGWNLDEALTYLIPILDALLYAKERGVVHGDLKPQNVMVSQNGARKVLGFAKSQRPDGDKLPGPVLGATSWAYKAPEVLAGARPDSVSDQYSLGVMAYQMLTGRLPVDLSDPGLKQQVPSGEIPREALEQFVLRMMNEHPERRFDSLDTVREGLMAIAGGLPWTPQPSPAWPVRSDKTREPSSKLIERERKASKDTPANSGKRQKKKKKRKRKRK